MSAEEKKVNIGAGVTYIPGFTNIDISGKADVILDLGKDKLPFDDDSIDLIFSYHTLEHVEDYLHAISEIHRVLKNNGRFLVGLPYATLSEYHLVNPYHLHNFNEFSFSFFDDSQLKGSAAESNPVIFKKIFHRYHYMGFFNVMPPPFRSWSRRHLYNVVRKIDFGLIAVKKSDEEVDLISKKTMLMEFKQCMHSRIPYDVPQGTGKNKGMKRVIMGGKSWWAGNSS